RVRIHPPVHPVVLDQRVVINPGSCGAHTSLLSRVSPRTHGFFAALNAHKRNSTCRNTSTVQPETVTSATVGRKRGSLQPTGLVLPSRRNAPLPALRSSVAGCSSVRPSDEAGGPRL